MTHPIDETKRQQFEQAWQKETTPQINDFLPPQGSETRLGTLEELICIDMEMRCVGRMNNTGQRQPSPQCPPVSVEAYVSQFEELNQPAIIERLQDEWDQLHSEKVAKEPVLDTEVYSEDKERLAKYNPLQREQIPGYEILSEIHRGGQGVVYKARQLSTKREVALKVLLSGKQATDAERKRFLREVDLMASLKHPYVVTIYDSGITEDNLQYLVMELVRGKTLDAYMKTNQLKSLEEVLQLFLKICEGVNHAHLRGVIHRDLKPGNILIDNEGNPRILDFGLARPAGSLQLEEGPITLTGDFVGTLAYASPEQVEGNPEKIDIRTDIYSLGVVLYKMLTGRYPYSVVGQLADILKAIAEEEPTPPSSSKGKNAKKETGALNLKLDAILDAVVLKSLQKSTDQRYQAVNVFADDLKHYLAGDPPVNAQPPSVAHLMWRWMKSHISTIVWTLAIGFICGILANLGTAATSIRDIQISYYNIFEKDFPSIDPIPFAVDYRWIPEWTGSSLMAISLMTCLSIGLILAFILRSRDSWSNIISGLTAGTIFSLVTYTMSVGWGLSLALTTIPAISEVAPLTNWEAYEGEGTDLKVVINVQKLVDKYPDLEGKPLKAQGQAVLGKLVADSVIGLEQALWTGILGVMIPATLWIIAQTVLAGILLRRCKRFLSAIVLYYLLVFPVGMLSYLFSGVVFFMLPVGGSILNTFYRLGWI